MRSWKSGAALRPGAAEAILRKRSIGEYESEGAADPIPDVEVGMPTVDAPSVVPEEGERKLRFRLIKFQDMRPGLETAYLVDELIPSAGLVLVWGKQKTFKSFWLLDLFVHVAMGWPYRDHAVRQGPVIYCAFEGGHGYKGRIEAIRRHYGISDDVDVPLYVMPGQVDLHCRRKGTGIARPWAETPTHVITMAFDPDLDVAAASALREMIVLIERATGLSAADAYSLCSIAADMHVTQLGLPDVTRQLPTGWGGEIPLSMGVSCSSDQTVRTLSGTASHASPFPHALPRGPHGEIDG